jgi:hypothetical protein
MRVLDRTRLLQSPDHPIVEKPWQFDVLELECGWRVGNDGLYLEIVLSKPMRSEVMNLRFMGVTDLNLDGFQPWWVSEFLTQGSSSRRFRRQFAFFITNGSEMTESHTSGQIPLNATWASNMRAAPNNALQPTCEDARG